MGVLFGVEGQRGWVCPQTTIMIILPQLFDHQALYLQQNAEKLLCVKAIRRSVSIVTVWMRAARLELSKRS